MLPLLSFLMMMKKLFPLMLCILLLNNLCACRQVQRSRLGQNSEKGVVFLDTLHDFGIIPQDNPLDSFDFKFVNHTGAAMMVLAVETSCECTTATYPHVAVPDGDTSCIHVAYDGRGRGPEAFFRQVMVTTSNADDPYLLEIYGEVK